MSFRSKSQTWSPSETRAVLFETEFPQIFFGPDCFLIFRLLPSNMNTERLSCKSLSPSHSFKPGLREHLALTDGFRGKSRLLGVIDGAWEDRSCSTNTKLSEELKHHSKQKDSDDSHCCASQVTQGRYLFDLFRLPSLSCCAVSTSPPHCI